MGFASVVRFSIGIGALLGSRTVIAQSADPAAALCLGLLKIDMKDTRGILSDEYHFNQFKQLLQDSHFSTYNEYQGAMAGLGFTIPDTALGFQGDYQQNSGLFQQQLTAFLSSTYNQAMSRSSYSSHSSNVNSGIVSAIDKCNAGYFDRLRLQQTVTVEPQGYDEFTIIVRTYIPPSIGYTPELRNIEPSNDLTCTSRGKAIALPMKMQSGHQTLTCTKDSKRELRLVVDTSIEVSPALTLPREPDVSMVRRPQESSNDTVAAAACVNKEFKTELVKQACMKGGQIEAKSFMKAFMKEKNIKSCNYCHSKLAPNYELKGDAIERFQNAGGK